jgi:hypothetical protein
MTMTEREREPFSYEQMRAIIAELLVELLYSAYEFFHDQNDDREEPAESALCIAWYVVKASGFIDDETARAIVGEMSSLAFSMYDKDSLSADTLRRLERIQTAARGLDD